MILLISLNAPNKVLLFYARHQVTGKVECELRIIPERIIVNSRLTAVDVVDRGREALLSAVVVQEPRHKEDVMNPGEDSQRKN